MLLPQIGTISELARACATSVHYVAIHQLHQQTNEPTTMQAADTSQPQALGRGGQSAEY